MRHFCLLAASLIMSTLTAHADNITYAINLQAGSATAQGTITTDGHLGALSTSDILAFQITLSQGATTAVVSAPPAGSYGVYGTDLTATATDLSYDFADLSPNFFGLGVPNTLCFSGNGDCLGATGPGVDIYLDGKAYQLGLQTEGVITSGLATTPEPSSMALLGTGFLGVAGVLRKRLS